MDNQGLHLTWISVADLDAAIRFYTETLGFTLHERSAESGWAEVKGPSGAHLGIAQYNPTYGGMKPGSNAVPTVVVKDMDQALKELQQKKVRLEGEVMEVPGEVKLQTFIDPDGNTFQLCQLL